MAEVNAGKLARVGEKAWEKREVFWGLIFGACHTRESTFGNLFFRGLKALQILRRLWINKLRAMQGEACERSESNERQAAQGLQGTRQQRKPSNVDGTRLADV